MYFGSVKFFKHLIYTVIILVLAAIIGCAVLFGVKYSIVKKENDELVKAASVDDAEQSEHLSLDEYYLHMAADGYTADDVLDFLAKNESGKFDSFAEKYISENPDKFAVIPRMSAAMQAAWATAPQTNILSFTPTFMLSLRTDSPTTKRPFTSPLMTVRPRTLSISFRYLTNTI